jgi:acetyl-CoA acetyltransferase
MMGSPQPPAQWIDAFSRVLGLQPAFYLNVSRGGQAAHNGILMAMAALENGLANYVVVACGLNGWSGPRGPDPPPTAIRGGAFHGTLDFGLGRLGFDAGNAATVHGFFASRHMHEFGTTEEQLGAVAVATRAWANINPDARFHDRTLSMDDYLAAPYVVRPLRVPDCCVQSDLGGAIVLTTAERAQDSQHAPIYIKGLGLGDQARALWWDKANYTSTDGAFAKEKAFADAGLELSDVDLALVYDCFTTEVVMYLEDYGWCDKGDGGTFAASGALAPGGSIPVNTHGGMLSGMYLLDFPNVIEAVRQLRGAAGERQVEGAKVALTNGHGGEMVMPGVCCSHAVMLLGSEPA